MWLICMHDARNSHFAWNNDGDTLFFSIYSHPVQSKYRSDPSSSLSRPFAFWMSRKTNEWMNIRTNEWMNEWWIRAQSSKYVLLYCMAALGRQSNVLFRVIERPQKDSHFIYSRTTCCRVECSHYVKTNKYNNNNNINRYQEDILFFFYILASWFIMCGMCVTKRVWSRQPQLNSVCWVIWFNTCLSLVRMMRCDVNAGSLGHLHCARMYSPPALGRAPPTCIQTYIC